MLGGVGRVGRRDEVAKLRRAQCRNLTEQKKALDNLEGLFKALEPPEILERLERAEKQADRLANSVLHGLRRPWICLNSRDARDHGW